MTRVQEPQAWVYLNDNQFHTSPIIECLFVYYHTRYKISHSPARSFSHNASYFRCHVFESLISRCFSTFQRVVNRLMERNVMLMKLFLDIDSKTFAVPKNGKKGETLER